MSIAEFSKVMRSHALNSFRSAYEGRIKDKINPLLGSGILDERRKVEERKTSFILSYDTIKEIRESLPKELNLPSTDALFKKASNITNRSGIPRVEHVKVGTGTVKTIIYPHIGFDSGINNLLKDVFGLSDDLYKTYISSNLQKGHVIGLASNMLEKSILQSVNTENTNLPSDNVTNEEVSNLVHVIDLVLKDLRKADIATSNFKSESSYEIFGSYTKTPYKYLVELQPKVINETAGRQVASALDTFRKMEREGHVGHLKVMGDFFKESSILDSLVNAQTSPSMLQLIEASILEALDPIQFPKTKKTFFAKNIPIAQFTNKIEVNNQKLKASLQKEIRKLEQTKTKLKRDAKNRARTQKGQFASIANIQILLNARIHEQIKQNMGSGSRRDILNLRTGRFAETVQIERLNLQRDNAIAVFYSYMKYPYATFSSGGEQSYPGSRDPVTLINKSIREIASTLVTNKLRMFSI